MSPLHLRHFVNINYKEYLINCEDKCDFYDCKSLLYHKSNCSKSAGIESPLTNDVEKVKGLISYEQVMAGSLSGHVRGQRSGQCVCCGFQYSVIQTAAEHWNACSTKVNLCFGE